MSVACPRCGSRFLRESRMRADEKKLRFRTALRCQDCQNRFLAPTFVFSDLKWSRCPVCQRMDLNSWRGKTYVPPFFTAVKIFFGAKRWRCEYCRINFASFRSRKEVFTFSRWRKFQAGESLRDTGKPGAAKENGAATGSAASGDHNPRGSSEDQKNESAPFTSSAEDPR